MYEVYFHHFTQKVPLTEAEKDLIKSYLSVKKIRKRQYLLQEGDVCKSIAFVEKGMLRSYTLKDSGTEHIVQFAPEGWFISDLGSFLSGEPSNCHIDAIEDSELVMVTRAASDELSLKCPAYERYLLKLISAAYVSLQQRVNAINSHSIEDRYQDFLQKYPDIALRVPQHMIASYMGLSPETLSRVRRRIAGN